MVVGMPKKILKSIGLIPVRLESKRLPGKALLDLDGLPIIVHTAKRAQLSKMLDEVYVCTDSIEIIKICKKHKIKTIKTKKKFSNGTERIASIAPKFKNSIIVDIQGDEPLIKPSYIDKLIKFHKKLIDKAEIIIPTIEMRHDSSSTNVRVLKSKSNRVLFLSRAKVPRQYIANIKTISKHVSVISFTYNGLMKYRKLKKSYFEQIEDIELLRAIENDMQVYSVKLEGDSFSIDINDDYLRAKIAIKTDDIRKLY